MFRKTTATVLCLALLGSACASAGTARPAAEPVPAVMNQAVLAEYVQHLPAGSRIRVERANAGIVRGTLMKATDQGIVVQANTRIPEAPLDIPLTQITRVMLETNGTSPGKVVAIGVGSGIAAALGVLLLIIAASGN